MSYSIINAVLSGQPKQQLCLAMKLSGTLKVSSYMGTGGGQAPPPHKNLRKLHFLPNNLIINNYLINFHFFLLFYPPPPAIRPCPCMNVTLLKLLLVKQFLKCFLQK